MKTGAIVNVSFDAELSKTANPFLEDIYIEEKIKGKSVLEHLIERLRGAKSIEKIIIVTSGGKGDEKVVEFAKIHGIEVVVSNEPFFFERTFKVAEKWGIQTIIAALPWCFLLEPELIDEAIKRHISTGADFTVGLRFPTGTEPIVVSSEALKKMVNLNLPTDVRSLDLGYILRNPDVFKTEYMMSKEGEKYYCPELDLRILNYSGLEKARRIYDRLHVPSEIVNVGDIIKLFKEEPELFAEYGEFDIEVTNDCNLNCVMCPRNKMTREVGCMDVGLYKEIIDQLIRIIGAKAINLTMYGEPLIHPSIIEIVRYTPVNLFTNGILLDEAKSRELIEAKLRTIIFSLDAATDKTYEKIKGSSELDRVKANIKNFLKIKQELKANYPKRYKDGWPTAAVQIVKMKENDQEIEPFFEEWDIQEKVKKKFGLKQQTEKIGTELKRLNEEAEKIREREGQSRNLEEVRKRQGALQNELRILDNKFWDVFYGQSLPLEHVIIGHFNNFCGEIEDRGSIDVTPLKRFPCRQLNEGVSIFWNGDVVLCRQDFDGKMAIGNLKKDSLQDILNSPERKELIEAHKIGDYSKGLLCFKCKDWYYPRA